MKESTNHIVRILIKGGILTPGVFLKITKIATQTGNKEVSFGSRQDVLFSVPNHQKIETEEYLKSNELDFEWKTDDKPKTQNIVSSFVANDVFPSTSWVNPGAYIHILEGFDYHPKIKINIVDPIQKLVPHFSGHLNFIASEHEDYWHLYLRNPNDESMREWPELIYSPEIPKIARLLENIAFTTSGTPLHELVSQVNEQLKLNTLSNFEPLKRIPDFPPYYEGLHKMASGKDLWAGFYWRNNLYTIEFINHVCNLCLQTGIARISITPWKSFLVKNIKTEHRLLWEQMIGHFGINMRHSSFELYWHLPFNNAEALKLRRYLVRCFDKVDVRTFGLTFSIGKPDIPFTSVVIERKWYPKWLNWFNLFKTYRISYAKDFNPESNEYIHYLEDASFKELPERLINLSKKYYTSLPEIKNIQSKPIQTKKEEITIHQCSKCMTIYAPLFGNANKGVEAGTSFEKLPIDYCCETCDAPKSSFVTKQVAKNHLTPA
nr:rubredoxin domain-containing protein [uncultured Carboxylicivirga sp.]